MVRGSSASTTARSLRAVRSWGNRPKRAHPGHAPYPDAHHLASAYKFSRSNTAITVTFSESVQASSITSSTFVLKDPSNNTVTATVSYNDTTHAATLQPSSPLANSTTYTATISGATDAAGNTMTGPFSWSFTTTDAPLAAKKKFSTV